MQEVVETFFHRSITEAAFSNDLFPGWLHETLDDSTCRIDAKFEIIFDLLHGNALDAAFRQGVYEQVVNTNRISEICNGDEVVPPGVINWDDPLGEAIEVLMRYLYDALDLACFRRDADGGKPRHEFYKEFIKENKYVCAFCGLGTFKNILGPRREDLDHYFHKSKYPLAAANMRNLIPTCGTCNQDYKKAKDILGDGKAFYPYSDIPPVDVIVNCNIYPAPDDFSDMGEWSVEISLSAPDAQIQPMMLAWERVYSVSQRLENEVSEFFEDWMQALCDEIDEEVDESAFRQLLIDERDKASRAISRRMSPGEIIRAAFFDFMASRSEHAFLESFIRQINSAQTV